MKRLLSLLAVLTMFSAFSAMACPPTEGDYRTDIVVNGETVGSITNSVHYGDGQTSAVILDLAGSAKLAVGGAAAFAFGDNVEVHVFRSTGTAGQYAVQKRAVEPGESLSFDLRIAGRGPVNIQFVNGVFGQRPREIGGCGGPLKPYKPQN